MFSEEYKVESSVFSSVRVREILQKSYSDLIGQTVEEPDRQEATTTDSSLCFGEVLPDGVSKMLDNEHLRASSSRILYDLGMGLGKLVMQAFLEYPSLEKIVGVELAYSRFKKAECAIAQLAENTPGDNVVWSLSKLENGTRLIENFKDPKRVKEDTKAIVRPKSRERTLEIRRGNLFHVPECKEADIIVCETKIRPVKFRELCLLLNTAKKGTRILTYENLDEVYQCAKIDTPWKRLPINTADDVFPASWCTQGTHFHLFEKIL